MKITFTKKLNKLTVQKIISTLIYSLGICFFALSLGNCRKPPTDMRALAPAETLVYLETNDLGKMLEALTQNPSYQQVAENKPDFSALENTQAAIIVTNFETSEKQLTDESAVLNFKPNFALIADTHAWESTNLSLVENQIGNYARKLYGDVNLEKSEKNGAKIFIWTAGGQKKIIAAVVGSIIYVVNNEEVLDKCLAVKSGAAENLLKNENLANSRMRGGNEKIAFGYVSPEGIKQIADLAGVSVAVEASEEDVVRSFVAKILPPLMQKTAKELSWTARKTGHGIEDRILVKTDAEISSVWKETFAADAAAQFQTAKFLPANFDSITRYNLKNPQISWRSVLLIVSKQVDERSAKILAIVAGSLFEPYGVAGAENFLNAVNSEIVTARFNADGDKSVVIAKIKDEARLKSALSKELNFNSAPEKIGAANVWKAQNSELTAALVESFLILGDAESVRNCLKAAETGQNLTKVSYFQRMAQTGAAATTLGKDAEKAEKIAAVFGSVKENQPTAAFFLTETRFDASGIERRTISDFGLLGTLLEKIVEKN